MIACHTCTGELAEIAQFDALASFGVGRAALSPPRTGPLTVTRAVSLDLLSPLQPPDPRSTGSA